MILFCGFGVLSRINPTTIVALGFSAFTVGSALFLILELNQPFSRRWHMSASIQRGWATARQDQQCSALNRRASSDYGIMMNVI
jgi:hypothetical protein